MTTPAETTTNAAHAVLRGHDPQREAFVCGDDAITYGALVDRVARAAATWQAYGVERGDRVAIRLADSIDWATAYLGVIWAGGVAVGVNPRIPAEDWSYILQEGAFRLVLHDGDEASLDSGDRGVPLAAFTQAMASAAPIPPAAMREDEPCFWCHSSGSSGRPKAVAHAHRFASQVERVAVDWLGITADDRVLASSKLFFAYPLGNSFFAGLKIGATIVLDPQWPTAQTVAEAVLRHRPTVLFSVPALYRNLIKAGLARELGQHLRVCVSAGEALPPSLREEWRKQTGITIANGFGASETLSLVLMNRGEDDALAPTSGVDIVPVKGERTGGPTRVRIRGPMVALGYWNRPDAQAEHFVDGAFVPGDLFVQTEDARWRFAGREDSLVKINGRWVDLVALEERLSLTCFGIREGAVIAAPDSDGVPAIAFYYSPKPEVEACCVDCVQRCAAALPPYQRPRWLRAVPALPRTPTGKLLRRKLLDMHAAEALADESVVPVLPSTT